MYDHVEERERAKRIFHQIKNKYEKGNFQGAIRQLESEKDLLGTYLDIGSQLNLNKIYANSAFALMRKAVEVDKDGGKFAELFRQYGSMLEVHLPANRYKDLIELRKRAFSGRFSSSNKPKRESSAAYVLPDPQEEQEDLGYREVPVQRIPKAASVKNRYNSTMDDIYGSSDAGEDASYADEENVYARPSKKSSRKTAPRSRPPARNSTLKIGRIFSVVLVLLLLLAGGVFGIPRVKNLLGRKNTPPPVIIKSQTESASAAANPSALPTETMTAVPSYETAVPETATPTEGGENTMTEGPTPTEGSSGEVAATTNAPSTSSSKTTSKATSKATVTKVAPKPAQTSIVEITPTDSSDTSSTASAPVDANYILPSHTKTITNDDLVGMSKAQVQRAINEIYARHGYEFDQAGANYRYFMEQPWYANLEKTTSAAVAEGRFSDLERKNLGFLLRYKESLN